MATPRHLSETRTTPRQALLSVPRPSINDEVTVYDAQPGGGGFARPVRFGTTLDSAGFQPAWRVAGATHRRRQLASALSAAQRARSRAATSRLSTRRPRRTPDTLPARAGQLDALAARLAETKARVLTTQEAADMLHVCTKYLRESACIRYVLSPTKTLWLDVDLYAFLLTTRFAPAEHVPTAEGDA